MSFSVHLYDRAELAFVQINAFHPCLVVYPWSPVVTVSTVVNCTKVAGVIVALVAVLMVNFVASGVLSLLHCIDKAVRKKAFFADPYIPIAFMPSACHIARFSRSFRDAPPQPAWAGWVNNEQLF